LRYVRAPVPVLFPSEERVPESLRHMKLRTFLFEVLDRAFGAHASVGSDQFVYFRASTPKRCLAPDAFVRLGPPSKDFDSWKTWERGTPHVGIEIESPHERPVASKLPDYHEAGFLEVVWFDADAPEGKRIRVWDRVEGDLVERIVEGDRAPSVVLGGSWVVGAAAGFPVALRYEDAAGLLVPSADELLRAEAERARTEAERARTEAERARTEAERARTEAERARTEAERASRAETRVAELEAELARRRDDR
jgi:hypothetical protein